MKEITTSTTKKVQIENKTIVPWREYKGTEEVPFGPKNFTPQKTTVWSFPSRGSWASHTPQYRGNWAPEVVRNILTLYSRPGNTILDPMVGGGTTPVECLLTGRNSISVDINEDAINITRDRLNLPQKMINQLPHSTHRTFVGDTRDLNLIKDCSIDLITAHPPYVNIIKYTPQKIDGDLSQFDDYKQFFTEYSKAIAEYYRVLTPGGFCAVLIGDTHNKGHYVPVATHMMIDFLKEGFILKEDIIKREWNCDSTLKNPKYSNTNFMLTMHEHLFIFEKPKPGICYNNSSFNLFQN